MIPQISLLACHRRLLILCVCEAIIITVCVEAHRHLVIHLVHRVLDHVVCACKLIICSHTTRIIYSVASR